MKKSVIAIVIVVLLVLMLFPLKLGLNDGGTSVYKAAVYEVWDVHRMTDQTVDGEIIYIEGWIVSILGIEVYNSAGITTN